MLRRLLPLAVVDVGWWVGAVVLLALVERGRGTDPTDGELVAGAVLVATVALVAGLLFGLYRGRWVVGSFEELAGVARAALVAAVVGAAGGTVLDLVPPTVPFLAAPLALVGSTTIRYLVRLSGDRDRRPAHAEAQRAIVVGAGEGGAQILNATLRNPDSPYLPVALVDDDPRKQRLEVRGVTVLGTRADIPRIAAETGATSLLIAIPSADPQAMRALHDLGVAAGLDVVSLPPVGRLLGPFVDLDDVRPLTDADLLGRPAIDTDVESIAGYLTGQVVLVTGAGGSIGSELCRQIVRYEPAELVLLDHDESALHACQLSLDGRGQLDTPNLVVASIRDPERIREVFEQWRPDVVFHAAALKHVPLLEMHPAEAVKTNVEGTRTCVEAAEAVGVTTFVNISTDKAADPSNALGRTKLEAERLVAAVAQRSGRTYVSVRFGNVLGSRGSVLTAFRAQIEAGGPVTVTDPDTTRYFMTVQEAVQLVIQAGAIGASGEVLVLEMGEPVRIDDVARRMVAAAGSKAEIVYTGLRPGEKLHEVLLAENERGEVGSHPLITHIRPHAAAEPPA